MDSRMSPRRAGGIFNRMRWLSKPFVVDHCVCTYMKTRFCSLAGTSYLPIKRCSVDMMSRNCALDLSNELIIAVMLPRMAAKTMAPATTIRLAKAFSTIVSGWTHGVLIRVVSDQYNDDMSRCMIGASSQYLSSEPEMFDAWLPSSGGQTDERMTHDVPAGRPKISSPFLLNGETPIAHHRDPTRCAITRKITSISDTRSTLLCTSSCLIIFVRRKSRMILKPRSSLPWYMRPMISNGTVASKSTGKAPCR
mmetsp:Transcript_71273/g.195302  ORF Transcript_71273/g.195302 Transcript_71273/m.195302 type:complete len:251 (-) Transcript_71273:462-1214(-)